MPRPSPTVGVLPVFGCTTVQILVTVNRAHCGLFQRMRWLKLTP
jgi:hypothetical protein